MRETDEKSKGAIRRAVDKIKQPVVGLRKWIADNRGRTFFMFVFAAIGIWGLLLEGKPNPNIVERFAKGMGPELAGIVIAAMTIDALAERRQEKERKKILIAQMGSKQRDITELAIIELRNRGWLYDGSLRGADLWEANLSGANLDYANLSESDLTRANLDGAQLIDADLSRELLLEASLIGTRLSGANLSGSGLRGAKLRTAFLDRTDLSGADLAYGDLSGANLRETDLSGAYLHEAKLGGAVLKEAVLSGAVLDRADLSAANLWGADLSGVRNWTIDQLKQATGLEGTIMPEGIQLKRPEVKWGTDTLYPYIEGPTFAEWKAQYLAKHGGDENTLRNPWPPDATAPNDTPA